MKQETISLYSACIRFGFLPHIYDLKQIGVLCSDLHKSVFGSRPIKFEEPQPFKKILVCGYNSQFYFMCLTVISDYYESQNISFDSISDTSNASYFKCWAKHYKSAHNIFQEIRPIAFDCTRDPKKSDKLQHLTKNNIITVPPVFFRRPPIIIDRKIINEKRPSRLALDIIWSMNVSRARFFKKNPSVKKYRYYIKNKLFTDSDIFLESIENIKAKGFFVKKHHRNCYSIYTEIS